MQSYHTALESFSKSFKKTTNGKRQLWVVGNKLRETASPVILPALLASLEILGEYSLYYSRPF